MIRVRKLAVRAPADLINPEGFAHHLKKKLSIALNSVVYLGIQRSPRRVYMSVETYNFIVKHSADQGILITKFGTNQCSRLGRVFGYLVYADDLPMGEVHVEYCKLKTESETCGNVSTFPLHV